MSLASERPQEGLLDRVVDFRGLRGLKTPELESCLARTALVPVCGEDHPLLDLVTSLMERTR